MFYNQQATQKIVRGEEHYPVHMLKPEHYNTVQKSVQQNKSHLQK